MLEAFGFITGVLNVWLLARQKVWNWPIGIANNLAYLSVFAISGLYGDAGLQLVYAALGLYGWWLWMRGTGQAALPVRRTSTQLWIALFFLTLAAGLCLKWFLARFTDSTVPAWDGATTALSLAATYGQCRKLLESWWIWILADLIYIPLYIYKGLWLTSILYAVFLMLCIFGLRSWSKESGSVQAQPRQNAAHLLR